MTRVRLERVSVHFPSQMIRAQHLGHAMAGLPLGGVFGIGQGGAGVTALRGIDLELNTGDRLGVIGHNGAGKTTLLRVLAGILPPTEGYIETLGQVSALLSITLGLDAEASGFDNIRYRARHMGIRETEIEKRFDDIVEFSDLGEYLNMPMKVYSSGMKLRLAFAIATAFRPDILILDEWLSAGDEAFRNKATQRLTKLMEESGVVVFASHNMRLLSQMCKTGIVLDHASIVFSGPIDDAIAVSRSL